MRIHQVKGRHVNSYVIEGRRLAVIDVAWRGEQYVLGFLVHELGRDPRDVELVVGTHDDPDHSGGLIALGRECEARVALPSASRSLLQKLRHNPVGPYYRLVTAVQEAMRPRMRQMYFNPQRDQEARAKPIRHARRRSRLADRAVPPDVHLRHHDPLPGFPDWLVLHTPGHSWDSCCFFHPPSRSLITGDTLLGSQKQGRVVPPAIYANPKQLAVTLSLLHDLNPAGIYPGHGSCFHGQGLLDHLKPPHARPPASRLKFSRTPADT